jgi:hypothetical protein
MSVIRTLESTENPLFSQASMSAAAAASIRPTSLNHRITRRRTRSVNAAKSEAVTGRAGRNVGAGDRVKNDHRDAITLARLARAGELTAIWVP